MTVPDLSTLTPAGVPDMTIPAVPESVVRRLEFVAEKARLALIAARNNHRADMLVEARIIANVIRTVVADLADANTCAPVLDMDSTLTDTTGAHPTTGHLARARARIEGHTA